MNALLLTAHLLTATLAPAAGAKAGFLDRVYTDAAGKSFKYVLFVPPGYTGDKDYPLILFLHGSGGKGDDGKAPSNNVLGKHVRQHEKDFPFFVLFPQARESWKADSADAARALAMLDATIKEYKIDARRVVLTGQSMGGYGTWALAAKYPDRWSAIVPICGGGDPASAPAIKDIPCWCFHGADDPRVKVEMSRQMIAALRAAGTTPKYDEYPGVGHNSWERAYNTDALYAWMLAQKRK